MASPWGGTDPYEMCREHKIPWFGEPAPTGSMRIKSKMPHMAAPGHGYFSEDTILDAYTAGLRPSSMLNPPLRTRDYHAVRTQWGRNERTHVDFDERRRANLPAPGSGSPSHWAQQHPRPRPMGCGPAGPTLLFALPEGSERKAQVKGEGAGGLPSARRGESTINVD
ncbi:hypothetical protein BDY21DRAFT_420962 [Lineolata rhizophorae]|uniref:Uncharacterized protein n=1 Tax=Lineolata rhizophorae TaxID=578093 RepID=A0A6A6P367_9PEZI|nr:hypothetical protein BDY21DRAFT_420962 [Lineolata rhizophorae]